MILQYTELAKNSFLASLSKVVAFWELPCIECERLSVSTAYEMLASARGALNVPRVVLIERELVSPELKKCLKNSDFTKGVLAYIICNFTFQREVESIFGDATQLQKVKLLCETKLHLPSS